MSQVPPKPEATNPNPTPKKKGGMRLVVLILIMLVMVGLACWDVYARGASQSSFEKVVKLVEEDLKEFTPADVQKLVGRQPDRGLEDNEAYALETYSWPRGILFQSYFVKVIYRKEGDKVLLHEVVHNIEPEDNDLPNPPVKPATPPATSEADEPRATEDNPSTTYETLTEETPAEDAAPQEPTDSDAPTTELEAKE
jgi:hypothetical protein